MFLNRRGFTMGEVLATLISLGVVVMAAQSLIMISKRFMHESSDIFSSMKDTNQMNNFMCLKFTNPVFAQMDRTRSYYFDPTMSTNGAYVKVDKISAAEKRPATLSYPLFDRSDIAHASYSAFGTPSTATINHTAVSSFLNGTFKSANPRLKEHVNDEAASMVETSLGPHNFKSKFYDVYADSHTLITFMADVDDLGTSSVNKLGRIGKHGRIFAARCIANNLADPAIIGKYLNEDEIYGVGSVVDNTDSNINDEFPEETALYIIEGLKYRPFYFPKNDWLGKVKCCDISASHIEFKSDNASECKTMKEYTPIVYSIRFASEGNKLGTDGSDAIANDQNSFKAYLSSSSYGTDYQNRVNACGSSPLPPPPSPPSPYLPWNEQNCIKEYTDEQATHYFAELRKGFDFPITFLSVSELPLLKADNPVHWASGFVAYSVENQPSSMQLQFLRLSNICTQKNLCPETGSLADRQEDNGVPANTTITSRNCPFRYVNLTVGGGGVIHMGSHFE